MRLVLLGAAAAALVAAFVATEPVSAQPTSNPEESEARSLHQEARRAMVERRWGDAELLLERALMLQPTNAEVMLDLAQMLAVRGRGSAGLAILQVLLDDPRTPSAQRGRLEELSQSIRQAIQASAGQGASPPGQDASSGAGGGALAVPTAAPRSQSLWAEWSIGHGRNPLLTTGSNFITITLPDGNFQLPLESTPRPAAYASTSVGWRSATGQQAQIQAQHFNLDGVATAWRMQFQQPVLQRGNNISTSGHATPWVLGVSARALQYTDSSRRYQAAVEWQQGQWVLSAGGYEEEQRQRAGAMARIHRAFAWEGSRPLQLNLWLEAESNQRAGPPGYGGGGIAALWQPWPSWTLQASWSAQRDTRGYSPLLARNAPRQLMSVVWSVEYAPDWQLGNGFVVLRAYQSSRSANIDLFQGKDQGIQVVWRYLR